MTQRPDVRYLSGAALKSALPDIAALRITVFADWPYLYDGDMAYEERYLQAYLDSAHAVVLGAYDGETLIGASTGTPLLDHADNIGAALAGRDLPLERIFYCAESVLLPAYRGLGLGHRFFDEREAFARAHGFQKCCFCAVVRPADHPARPKDHRALDAFWRGRGYAPVNGAIATLGWKDRGASGESDKPLQVWMRDL